MDTFKCWIRIHEHFNDSDMSTPVLDYGILVRSDMWAVLPLRA